MLNYPHTRVYVFLFPRERGNEMLQKKVSFEILCELRIVWERCIQVSPNGRPPGDTEGRRG